MYGRRGWLCLLVTLCVCLAVGRAWSAPPVIERVEVERARTDAWDPSVSWRETLTAWVRDADGAADLTRVQVVTPNGYAYELTPEVSGCTQWVVEGPDLVRASVLGSPYWSSTDPYVVTAWDVGNGEDSVSAPTASATTEWPQPELLYPAPNEALIHEVSPTFSWSGCQEGAENTLAIWKAFSWLSVWQHEAGTGTSAVYNCDGTATEATLSAGHTYEWSIESRKCDDCGSTDPRVFVYMTDRMTGRFTVYSESPVVQDVTITRLSRSDAPNWMRYGQSVSAVVTDGEGVGDMTEVTIVDSDAVVHTITPADWRHWRRQDTYTVLAFFNAPWWLQDVAPPSAGAYTVSVRDAAGHTGTLVTPVTQPGVAALTLLAPAEGSVIYDAKPTFRWDTSITTPYATLVVREEGGEGEIWRVQGIDETEAPYDFDGRASRAELQAGYTYAWWVSAEGLEDDRVTDPRVSIRVLRDAERLFTMYEGWPALPELPGKLAYSMFFFREGPDAIAGYGTDATSRTWLGPINADYPRWSPDGATLLYRENTLGTLWVDSLDGSPATPVPGVQADTFDWSADGSRIVYITLDQTQVRVVGAGGSGDVGIVTSDTGYVRYPVWSPDGEWIAYRRSPDPEGLSLWLVRPDGTENHALPATGVEGYPEYVVGYMGEHGWSPTGREIVTVFTAGPPEAAEITGIGVIAVGGGPIRPVFISPPGSTCCAAAHLPQWSPDGTKIVFTSGHHLPPNPDWIYGIFVVDTELWLANADGTGDPVRLTYNHSFDGHVSWWEEKVFLDVTASHWAYGAIKACVDAGIVFGFSDRTYRPGVVVSRDQMAVYIARALAGGDAMVPVAPAEPLFADVPGDYWAHKYIAYAKEQGVVQGYDDGSYQPALELDRGQMSAFMARAIYRPLGDPEISGYTPPAEPTFADVGTDFWAYRYVEYIADPARAVTLGCLDGLYHPEYACTRDQMAMYVARGFGLAM